jgi:hypothetical protein
VRAGFDKLSLSGSRDYPSVINDKNQIPLGLSLSKAAR